ncbi:MAG: type I restriction endonuclease subunit R [bacterium]|nr:type I restriction endonuclease subunit R [bacterium]
MKATSEKSFETYIHTQLLTTGWRDGSTQYWDKHTALFSHYIIDFIKETQPRLWTKMEALHHDRLPEKLIAVLIKERQTKGTLHVLRHGFKFYGETFKLAFFQPAHQLHPETRRLFGQNRLHVTRQAACHPDDTSTVDLLLSLNGLPIATIELKNPATGQNVGHAVAQYKTARDPHAPLFLFKKGALVHFALDPDQIRMTTRLNKEKTFFLPFNRGSNPGEIYCGKGNPPHPSGHGTAYFWEEVLQPASFIDIIGSFIFLQTEDAIIENAKGVRQKISKETMIFPRYHQLDAVRRLVAATRKEQAGNWYLVQHSAGSGKTNSISWLSHRLAGLHTETDQKVFDCVVVVTDRRVLDSQLQDAIYQIEHARGVVKAIDKNSRQLAEALIDGTKIVITTLQKFPFILKGLLHIAGADNVDNPDEESVGRAGEWQAAIANRTYAVIVDEAHSSQSGESAEELKSILGAGPLHTPKSEEAGAGDWQDGINQVLDARGRQKNLSFYAFTATPKGKTLNLFGRKESGGKPAAFHTYSMKQAIEEGFILDVLRHYTTYGTYYKLVKKIGDDPVMPNKEARKKLARFMSLHPYNIAQKTEIIIEHFRRHVRHKLEGRAKAMVVTGSRLHAVRYKRSFDEYIKANRYTDIRPLVAFSGKVLDEENGGEYTEPGMNTDVVTGKPITEAQLPDKFDSSDYNVLIVANKYQTGFDQPLLCAMYVDKRLDNVQAVQTLSRLNRTLPGKEPPFVLDFVNSSEDIGIAFKPYYTVTTLEQESDPYHLERLRHELELEHVHTPEEVSAFGQVFYLPPYKQRPGDHARLEKIIKPAVDRFEAMDMEARQVFHKKLTAYIHLYAFLSQIIDYSDMDLEMLYGYGRFLLAHISVGEDGADPHPEDKVALQYYRTQVLEGGSIDLDEGDPVAVNSPGDVGTGKGEDEDKPLSEIIEALNDRFGTAFSEEDRLLLEQFRVRAAGDERVINTVLANPLDKFSLGIMKVFDSLMMQRLSENDEFVTRYMDDPDFKKTIFPLLAKAVYRDVLEKQAAPTPAAG